MIFCHLFKICDDSSLFKQKFTFNEPGIIIYIYTKFTIDTFLSQQFITIQNQFLKIIKDLTNNYDREMESILSQDKKNEIKQLFKDQNIHQLLIQYVEEIFDKCLSVIIIYQKLFIKIKHRPKNSPLHIEDHQHSLFMIKVNRNFPLEGSVRVYLLDGCYQPKIYDTRDLAYQILGELWSWKHRFVNILENIPQFQQKLIKRNQNYLALQRTGQFLLGDIFLYNQLQEHSSLSLFVDKSKQNNSTLIGISQTHFLTFKKVIKKCKTKQQQDYQLKSKTLYGKKFLLTRCCQLECIDTLSINIQTKQVGLTILKYKSVKSFNQFSSLTRRFNFGEQQQVAFIRCILKSITKFQPMKIEFIPSLFEKDKNEGKQESAVQKVLDLNELESRLETGKDLEKREQILNKLNKSYQKLIQFYSARANPYYLIYVNKLNWLYNKFFIKKDKGQTNKGQLK